MKVTRDLPIFCSDKEKSGFLIGSSEQFSGCSSKKFQYLDLFIVVVILILSAQKSFAVTCREEVARQEAIAAANNAAHTAEYNRCIACCDGIAPPIQTRLCGGLPIPNHVLFNSEEVWTEYLFCNAIVLGGACTGGKISVTQCGLTDEKQKPECPSTGNPIILANANKFQTEVDYKSQRLFGLNFIRYYNSSAYDIATDMGVKWSHSFSYYLNSSPTSVLIHHPDGHSTVFKYDGNIWLGDPNNPESLEELVDNANVRTGWKHKDSKDNVIIYNTSGKVISISNRAGQAQNFYYDIPSDEGGDDRMNTLDKVVGFSGDTITFTYDPASSGVSRQPFRIETMTDPEGKVYRYNYSSNGHLESAVYPDDSPLNGNGNPIRRYHYEDSNFPYHLTGITDELGSRYVTWVYDNQGRAVSSEYADGVDKSILTFNIDDSVTVTNSLGKDTTYHFISIHGVKKLTEVEGHPTSSCAGANKGYTYDDNGYLASKTDWQGNVTTYIHDDKGLELSRTEAAGTPEARTINTEWHPVFRLPIKITTLTSITEFTYDTNGNLISRTESPLL